MGEIVIASACRTAIGTFGGTLKDVPAAELGAIVVKEAVKRAGIKPEMVDEVIFGNVLQAGLGQNIARQVTLKAGLPIETTAMTINIVCGSGLKSVALAANQILAGESEIVVCGGTENMSAAPYAIPSARWGARMNNSKMIDVMVNDGLWDAFNQYHMGITAENVAEKYGITREMQDEFAVASQSKAEAAANTSCISLDTIFLCNIFSSDTHMILIESIPQSIIDHNINDLVIVHPCTPTCRWNGIWRCTHVLCTAADNDFRFACKDLVGCHGHTLQT